VNNVHQIIQLLDQNDYVCPLPNYWQALWELLPNRHRNGSGWIPSAPLILAAWWNTSNMEKRERLVLHLNWAKEHGVLAQVEQYLNNLKPDQWHIRDTNV